VAAAGYFMKVGIHPMARGSWPGKIVHVENPRIKAMKTSLKRSAILILASALAVVFSAGCGTVRGFGKDVGTVGEGIEKSTR
jgi:predicted small secreted protein